MEKSDIAFMMEAIKEAKKAYGKGEVPIGAVVVKDGYIIGRGHNETEFQNDVTAHGEIIAIRKAENTIGGWRLNGCTMYVTAEPCTMCAGAMVLSRIDRLVTGAPSPKSGACYTIKNLLIDDRLNHTVELTSGILENECSRILKDFFRELRTNKSKSNNKQAEDTEVGNNFE